MSVLVACIQIGKMNSSLRYRLYNSTHVIENSYCFYYLVSKTDLMLVGFKTPTSAAFSLHLAKYKTRPKLKLKSSGSYLFPTGKQICVENRKIKRRARIA